MRLYVALTEAAAVTSSCFGAILGTTGAALLVSPPPSLLPGVYANKNIAYAFNEKTNVLWAGGYDKYLPTVGVTYTLGTLSPSNPGPRRVNSHIIHFDNQGQPLPYPTVVGTVTFDAPIIGIICTNLRLDASDAALGNPGTTYPFGVFNRGISNFTDAFKLLSPNTLQFTLANGGAMDEIRVLTLPSPGCLALLGLGGAAIGRRRS